MKDKKDKSLTKSFLLKDMILNLDVDLNKAELILQYFKVLILEELLYGSKIRVGDIGVLKVKSTEKGLSISFSPFQNFLEAFRDKYRLVHQIEKTDDS